LEDAQEPLGVQGLEDQGEPVRSIERAELVEVRKGLL
jgi:hypothetical protein